MNNSKKSFWSRLSLKYLRQQRSGITLIELLVTIAILTVVGSAGLVLFNASYRTVRHTEERIQQINRGSEVLGALNALLSSARGADLGRATAAGLPELSAPGGATIPATPAGILPPSLSGQQLTFASGSKCYRVFYRQQAIWLAVASSCNSLAQAGTGLQRGPNQFLGSTFSSSSPLYDPVLDLTVNQQRVDPSSVLGADFTAYQLATGVEPLPGQTAVFSYKFLDFNNVATSASGDLGDNLPFYTAGNNQRDSIVAIEASFQVLSGNPDVSAKQYRQLLFIDQS